MKKIQIILFTLLTLLFTVKSFSAGGSYLQLSLYDDADFTVTFDDKSYTDPGNIVEFDDVQPGDHSLIVSRTASIDPSKGNVIFQGNVKIPAGLSVYAVIDEYNAFSIYKKVSLQNGRCDMTCSYYRFIGKKGSVEVHEHRDNDLDVACRNSVMSEKDFKDFKKSIGNLNFENTNVTITKSMLDQNTVSTKQMAELLTYFTFESNKLEVAKYAYAHTCDKKNYYKLYSSFNFDSSIEELKNYISGK